MKPKLIPIACALLLMSNTAGAQAPEAPTAKPATTARHAVKSAGSCVERVVLEPSERLSDSEARRERQSENVTRLRLVGGRGGL